MTGADDRMSVMARWRVTLALLFGLFAGTGPVEAAEIRVGVAANFAATLAVLAEQFEKASGHRVVISSGSTGKLYAQIRNGAPFDIYLAADAARPWRLEQEGAGVPESRFTYAEGRLALWSREPNLVDERGAVLIEGEFRRLAIANPVTAPYGLAARQVMEKLGVWERLQARLVRGENIAQTYQFVASGNAPLGFVAVSQLRARGGTDRGSRWEVPATLHAPIEQQAILLRGAREPAAANEFLAFLREPGTRETLKRFGYGVPVMSRKN